MVETRAMAQSNTTNLKFQLRLERLPEELKQHSAIPVDEQHNGEVYGFPALRQSGSPGKYFVLVAGQQDAHDEKPVTWSVIV